MTQPRNPVESMTPEQREYLYNETDRMYDAGFAAGKGGRIETPADASEARKATPIVEGCFDYFPNILAAVSRHSKFGNDKHNPGQPLHWSFDKSKDHANCVGRHLVDRGRIDPETGYSHTIALVWRALALGETELIEGGATPGRGVAMP